MPQRVSLASMVRRPPAPPPGVVLPQEAPNRPFGTDWLGDAADILMGGLGLNNPLAPEASRASQVGGMLSAAVPLMSLARMGKAARDLQAGFTLPQSKAALSETRMQEFLAGHGGTAPPMSAADAETIRLFQQAEAARPSLAAMGSVLR